MNIQMLCQVTLSIFDEVKELLSHKSVKLICRGKGKSSITQITMNLSENGEVSNPVGVDFVGDLGLKVQAKTWIRKVGKNGSRTLHYTQNVCDLHGRKLQPLYVNGRFAIFRYDKIALVQACHERMSLRIITLYLNGNKVQAEEVLPWTNTSSKFIRTEEDRAKFLKNFVLKASNKSQYIDVTVDALQWAKRTCFNNFSPSYFLTRDEVAKRKAALVAS